MSKSTNPKRPRDINQIAFQIVQEATGQAPKQIEEPVDPVSAAASALGRLGAKKGGHARAAKLTPERRKEIARKAIAARWDKKSNQSSD